MGIVTGPFIFVGNNRWTFLNSLTGCFVGWDFMNTKSSKQPWGLVMEAALRGFDAAVAELFARVRIKSRWEV